MKIVVITNLYPNSMEPNKGTFIKSQVDCLAKICSVKVIAPLPFYKRGLWFKDNDPRHNHVDKENIEGIEVYHPRYFYTPKIGRCFYGLFFFFSIYSLLKKIEKSFKPDSYLNYWAYPDGFATVLAAKVFNKKVIVSSRGCDVNHLTKNFLLNYQIKWALNNSDLNHTVSDNMRDFLVNLGIPGDKLLTIPNGIDKERFRPMDMNEARRLLGFRTKKKAILYLGRLSEEKNVEMLIRAFAQLENNQYILILVGDGSIKKRLMRVADSLGVAENVVFKEECSHSDVPLWMNAADLFCLPSKREGWPNALMEAIACGKPVVASRVGGVEEIVYDEKFGFLFEPNNIDSLRENIVKALQKKWDPQVICSNKKLRSWDKVSEEIYTSLEKVVNG